MTATSILRGAFRLVLIATIVFAIYQLTNWTMAQADRLEHSDMVKFSMIVLLLCLYALLIAIPFVPGVEIGLSLLAIDGARIAPFVYLATVLGLMLAFTTGYRMKDAWLAERLEGLRLRRAARLLREAAELSPERRLVRIRERLPSWAAPAAIRFRYLGLALLINLPGSSLIGGGGGICLIAGLSRMFRPAAILLTIALAVAPVPLVVWWFGGMPDQTARSNTQ